MVEHLIGIILMRVFLPLIAAASAILTLIGGATVSRPPIAKIANVVKRDNLDAVRQFYSGVATSRRANPLIVLDGRMLLQRYDQHNQRTDVIIRKPVQKSRCSDNMDPYIK